MGDFHLAVPVSGPRFGDNLLLSLVFPDGVIPLDPHSQFEIIVIGDETTQSDQGGLVVGREILREREDIPTGTARETSGVVLRNDAGDQQWFGGGGVMTVRLLDSAGRQIGTTGPVKVVG